MIGDKRGTIFAPATDYEYTLANEIKADYNTHIADTTYHVAADATNAVTSTDSTTLATVITLANEMKADFNAHLILAGVHLVNDAHNGITASGAVDLASVYVLLNELRTKYNAHVALTDKHKVADTTNVVTSTIVGDASPDIDFNADGGSVLVQLTGASSWDGTVDFQTTPDGATFYNIPYIIRSTITPTPTVAQISSPSTAAIYMLLGPLSQVRLAVGAGTTGNLTVVWRTIQLDILTVAHLAAGSNNIGDVDVLSVIDTILSKTRHPFAKGNLTTNGVQYSTAVASIDNDAYDAIETVTIQQPPSMTLEEIEFGLTGRLDVSGTPTDNALWKWQASDVGTTWVDLIAEQTLTTPAAATDVSCSGRFVPVANFLCTGTSFQVRMVAKSSGATDTVTGETKNSSYIIAKYRRT